MLCEGDLPLHHEYIINVHTTIGISYAYSLCHVLKTEANVKNVDDLMMALY
jgi:hypothetical protein